MNFEYRYLITYADGHRYESRDLMAAEISKEDYKKIVKGVLNDIPIAEIEGIEDALKIMKDQVLFIDKWKNRSGTWRKTALKNPRAVSTIEFFMRPDELERFQKYPDPMTVIDRPEEHMTVYRSDGSCVEIGMEFGKVKMRDSRNRGCIHVMDADFFLSCILH